MGEGGHRRVEGRSAAGVRGRGVARPQAQLEFCTAASPFSFILLINTLNAGGWVAPLAEGLETILRTFQGGLDAAHVPYSYGFSIILLTMLVKLVTFPLTKQQVRGSV